MKFIHTTLLIITLASTTFTQQESLSQLVRRMKPAVVTITVYDATGKPLRQGSGFFIASGRIVTNSHIVEKSQLIKVKIFDGSEYTVQKITDDDTKDDLALLQVDVPTTKVSLLPVIQTLPEEGDKVFVIGNPLGLGWTVTDGIVSSIRNDRAIGRIIQISAPISPGSSGSPVINLKGQVIGVAVGAKEGGQNLNFAIPGERVLALMSRNELTIPVVRSTVSKPNNAVASKKRAEAEALIEQAFKIDYKLTKRRLNYFERAAIVDPTFPEAWYFKGVYYRELKRYSDAIFSLKRSLELDPTYANSYSALGSIYGEFEQYEEALSMYEKYIQYSDHEIDDFSFYDILGSTYAALKRYNEALSTFKKSLSLNPSHSYARVEMGRMLNNSGRFKEAVETLQIVLKFEPQNADAHFLLGLAYLGLGDKDSVKEQYRILLNLNAELAEDLLERLTR